MNAPSLNKSSEQRSNEPSMEDILASIRRIIADDRMLPLTQRSSAPGLDFKADEDSPPPEDRAPPILEQRRGDLVTERLSDSPSLRVLPGGAPAPQQGRPAATPPEATSTFADAEDIANPATRRDAPTPSVRESVEAAMTSAEADIFAEPLISASTDATVASSFQTLASTVFLQNTGMIEQSLRDLLRPMLKQWLDENLPSIVERLVRVEIERVARGARA